MHGRGVSASPNAQTHRRVRFTERQEPKRSSRGLAGRVYPYLEEILADKQVKAVHVLTPPAGHIPVALASLRAGKHVLVEKPVAWRVSEINKLQSAARKANRVCMPAHNYIYNATLQRAKRLIESGRLGAIASFWMLLNVFHSEESAAAYGGVLRAACVHHAYSLLYLLGRPRQVTATISSLHYTNLKCEDQASIVCQMPNGAIATLWCSWAANDPTSDPWTLVYKVLGTKGGIVFSWNEAQIDDHGGPGMGIAVLRGTLQERDRPFHRALYSTW